ncbi:MAG TPA: hypothetical protein VIF35_02170 [Streptosporangiaceae bacterium]
MDPGTIWRWDQALAADGVAGLVPARRGPKEASKLTPELAERIARAGRGGGDAAPDRRRDRGVDVQRAQCAGPGGVWRAPRGGLAAGGSAGLDAGDDDAGQGAVVPVLPDPVSRDGERVLAR